MYIKPLNCTIKIDSKNKYNSLKCKVNFVSPNREVNEFSYKKGAILKNSFELHATDKGIIECFMIISNIPLIEDLK